MCSQSSHCSSSANSSVSTDLATGSACLSRGESTCFTGNSTLSLSLVEGQSDAESSREDSVSESEKGVNEIKLLMSVLRCPQVSSISRKGKQRTDPPTGKRSGCRRGFSDPTSVTPAQHVKEHPGEAPAAKSLV